MIKNHKEKKEFTSSTKHVENQAHQYHDRRHGHLNSIVDVPIQTKKRNMSF